MIAEPIFVVRCAVPSDEANALSLLHYRCTCFLRTSNWRRALQDAVCMLGLDAEHPDGLLFKATSLLNLGQCIDAAETARVALARDPDDAVCCSVRARACRGVAREVLSCCLC